MRAPQCYHGRGAPCLDVGGVGGLVSDAMQERFLHIETPAGRMETFGAARDWEQIFAMFHRRIPAYRT
jgi:hypothetical protein